MAGLDTHANFNAPAFISVLEVTTAQFFYSRAAVTSSTEMRNGGEDAAHETYRQNVLESPPRDLPGIAGR